MMRNRVLAPLGFRSEVATYRNEEAAGNAALQSSWLGGGLQMLLTRGMTTNSFPRMLEDLSAFFCSLIAYSEGQTADTIAFHLRLLGTAAFARYIPRLSPRPAI
jgi:hypothetical protein